MGVDGVDALMPGKHYFSFFVFSSFASLPLLAPFARSKSSKMHVHIPFLRPKSASIVSAGPLSVGVPLEGTDTVPGLRALERRAAAERIECLLGVAAANGTLFRSVKWVQESIPVLCDR